MSDGISIGLVGGKWVGVYVKDGHVIRTAELDPAKLRDDFKQRVISTSPVNGKNED